MLDFTPIFGEEKVAVHCQTEEEAELLFSEIWERHHEVVDRTTWDRNNTRFGEFFKTVYAPCIGVPNGILKFGSYQGTERVGYTIIPFSDLLAEPEYDEAEMQCDFNKLLNV